VPVGWCAEQADRDADGVGGQGAFKATFASVQWGRAGFVAAARGFGEAAVDGEVGQVQADHAVEGGQCQGVHPMSEAGGGPHLEPAADGGVGADRAGHPLVAVAGDQGLHDVLEHHPVRDAPAVAAQRMVRIELGSPADQCVELDPDRFQQR